jgi:hypothetical protein
MRASVLIPLWRKAGTDAPRPTGIATQARGTSSASRRGRDHGLRCAQHRPRNVGHKLVGQICDEEHHRESVADT